MTWQIWKEEKKEKKKKKKPENIKENTTDLEK